MMRSKPLTVFLIVILSLGITGCTGSNGLDSDAIRASGFIEGRVYKIASSLGGKVVGALVEQGDEVEAGEPLLTLDQASLKSARDQAQAAVDAAQASLSVLQEKPSTRDVAEAIAAVDRAEAELDAAKAARDLLLSSYEPLDPPESELNAAESAIDIAQVGVALAEAQLAQVKAGPFEAEQKILNAQLIEAQANLRLIELQLEDLVLRAPINGVVIQVMNKEGEVVSPGSPVLYLMDPNFLTLKLYLPVAQVAKIHIGDEFEITADAYPDDAFSGSVLHIADEAQFTPATVLTQEERVKLVFAVEFLIEDQARKLKPGMPVDAACLP
jgi:HlyD family secretion protein